MSEYVPTTEQVQAAATQTFVALVSPDDFDTWLAAHDREVKAEAWDEAVEAMVWAQQNGPEQHWLPYVRDNNPYRIESEARP